MHRDRLIVIFVDQTGAVFQESFLVAAPRIGDSIDLPDGKVGGVVDLVTWQVPVSDFSPARVFVRLKPHG